MVSTARRAAGARGIQVRGRLLAAVGAVTLGAAGLVAAGVSTSSAALNPNALFVSPSGSAGAAGTESAPTTIAAAITKIGPGGTVYLRGGTYRLGSTVLIAENNDGTASAPKELAAYPGESPVLDFSSMATADSNRGLQLDGSHWRLTGFVVHKAGDVGVYVSGSNNVLSRLVARFNRDTGIQIGRRGGSQPQSQWPANNLVVSSESHDNQDPTGENADGFAAKLTVGSGNVFRYDVAHNNVDDGWDLFTKTETGPIGAVTIEDSLAYANGTLSNGTQMANGDRNGYKLGGQSIPVNHVIRRSIAYRNGQKGLTWNSNPGTIAVSDNVSVDNGSSNFRFDGGSSVFRGNTSCRTSGSASDSTKGSADGSNQFWSGSNGSRCSAYSGAMKWSFASDGRLVVSFGGSAVTPAPTTTTKTSTTTTSTTTATTTSTTTTKASPTTSTTKSTTTSTGATPTTTSAKPSPTTSTTSSSTPSASAGTTAGTVLLSTRFDVGDQVGWTLPSGSWSLRTAGGSRALVQSGKGTALALTGPGTWSDVDLRVTATSTGTSGSPSNLLFVARAQAGGHYALAVSGGTAELRRVQGGTTTVLASAPVRTTTGRPFTVRFVVRRNHLFGFVDGTRVVTATDRTFAAGRVGLGSQSATAVFDDLSVRTS